MKKLLSLVLVGVMLLAMASFAFAGTITWGGNLRVWYFDVMGPNDSLTSFQFDRFALTFKDAFSDHDGVSAELQWRNYAGNDTSATSASSTLDDNDTTGDTSDDTVSTTVNNTGTKQARLDSGYYYYQGLLVKGDEFDIGALSKLPFRLGLSKNANFVDTGLGSKLKIGNCVGFSYQITAPAYTIGLGVADANMSDIINQPGTTEGYSYSVRLDAGKNFFGLVPGLQLGGGYLRKLTIADTYTINKVVDIAYLTPLFWASAEKGFSTTTASGTEGDCKTGIYLEAGFNIGANKVWAGRLIQDNDSPLITYTDAFVNKKNLINSGENGNILAAILPISSNGTFQLQYIVLDNDMGKEIDVRYQVSL